MFYDEIPWFYRDFESENLFLKPVLSARILDLSLETMLSLLSNEKLNTFATLKAIPSYRNRYHISIFWKSILSMFFNMG